MRSRVRALLTLLALWAAWPASAQEPPVLDAALREQIITLPVGSGDGATQLQTTVFRPPGAGPFPLVIINHGKASGHPRDQERARFSHAAREFVRRGYMVALPMRRGFAGSGGIYDGQGCDVAANTRAQAADVAAALASLARLAEVDAARIVLVGQSQGGLAVLGAAASHPPGVRAVINVAGGVRGAGCAWENALLDTLAEFGRAARVPALWLYGENDRYWGPELPLRMLAAYKLGGAPAQLMMLPPFKNDAHRIFSARTGVPLWIGEVERFLTRHGLPAGVVHALPDAPPAASPSGYAAVDDVSAVPYVSDTGRAGYRRFLAETGPRAFAVGPEGAWGAAGDGDDPARSALNRCRRHGGAPCRLYAVDDDVVWRDSK